MPKIYIIGIGTGAVRTITREAEEIILSSDCLIGDKRVLKPFEHLNKPVFCSSSVNEIKTYLAGCSEKDQISILVSGDVGFYSLAKTLLAGNPEIKAELICGISSLQYFCAKHKIPWEDVNVLSLHGRKGSVVNRVRNNPVVFILTGGAVNPAQVCRELCQAGLEWVRVSTGEDLSYPQEKITTGTARALAEKDFGSLSVMLVFNDKVSKRGYAALGLPDEMFKRGKTPMTKQEVRAVVLSKLRLKPSDTVFDIGAGTGSVAVEIALLLTDGEVYALEKDEEAVGLLQENKQLFSAYNLQVRQAAAPDGLAELPVPDKVFIGGSGGKLQAILNAIYAKNPEVRVVISVITLETLSETVAYFRNKTDLNVEIISVAVAKAQKLGDYNLLKGQNPVFIITAESKSRLKQIEPENLRESGGQA